MTNSIHISKSVCCLTSVLCCHLATDWRFAFTREGKNVPFATAGDCYSAARCPQVRMTSVRDMTGAEFLTATCCIRLINYN